MKDKQELIKKYREFCRKYGTQHTVSKKSILLSILELNSCRDIEEIEPPENDLIRERVGEVDEFGWDEIDRKRFSKRTDKVYEKLEQDTFREIDRQIIEPPTEEKENNNDN